MPEGASASEVEVDLRGLCELARDHKGWRRILREWTIRILLRIEALPPPPPCLLPPPPAVKSRKKKRGNWKGGGGDAAGEAMEGGAGVGSGGVQRRAGDWDCPSCGALVFATKVRVLLHWY